MLMLDPLNTRRDKSITDNSRPETQSSTASVGVFAKFVPQLRLLKYQTQALSTPDILVGGASNANHTYMPGGAVNHPVEGIVSDNYGEQS